MSVKHKRVSRGAKPLWDGLISVKRRAQGATIDFIVAFLIFITIFVVNYYSWNSVEVKIINTEDEHYFKTSVYQAVEDLIKNKGEPANWQDNTSSIISIGLAEEENVLSNEKLTALNNTSLQDLVLSTGDYQIIIKNKTSTVYQTGGSPVGRITRV
ncbi:hypothetical protein GF352_04995, partial [archaeon]|nr:hypothetical protein [archaeon]